MPTYKSTTDRVILETVAPYVIANKIKGVDTLTAFMEALGAKLGNLHNIRQGAQSFTIEHITNCCTHFDISADFIFGFSNQMHRTTKAKEKGTPLDRLKACVTELEALLQEKPKKRVKR